MIGRLWRIEPVETTGAALRTYLPVVMFNRGLAVLRLLAVAWLLGRARKDQFGLYNWAMELIAWVLPVMLLGLADVAERYGSAFQKRGQLGAFFRQQRKQLWITSAIVALSVMVIAPWVARGVLGTAGDLRVHGVPRSIELVGLAAINMVILARYQWLAGVLRGYRAYAASAGMETAAAIGFLIFAAAAAWRGGAAALLVAYGAANLLPLLWYELALRRHVRAAGQHQPIDPAAVEETRKLGAFGRWSFVRVILVTTFGFVSMSAVGLLAGWWAGGAGKATSGELADYGMAYRIAQMLAYFAITMWFSTYAVCARAWSHGQRKRAIVQFLRVGKLGAVLLSGASLAALWARGPLEMLLPIYADAIENLLPILLALFVGYGMIAFFATMGDLEERPWVGGVLWGAAVAVQIAAITGLALAGAAGKQAGLVVAWASVLGVAAALLVAAPRMLGRRVTCQRPMVPIWMMLAVSATLLWPGGGLDWILGILWILAVAWLWSAKQLLWPSDRRALRRWWAARSRGPSQPNPEPHDPIKTI